MFEDPSYFSMYLIRYVRGAFDEGLFESGRLCISKPTLLAKKERCHQPKYLAIAHGRFPARLVRYHRAQLRLARLGLARHGSAIRSSSRTSSASLGLSLGSPSQFCQSLQYGTLLSGQSLRSQSELKLQIVCGRSDLLTI